MYFAVVKLSFESTADTAQDRKDLRLLAEKLRARFKVCASSCASDASAKDTATAIALTALGSSEERLTHTLDAIAEFCENSGYGRITSEQTLMDHIDALADFAEASE